MDSLEIILEKWDGEPFSDEEKHKFAEEKNQIYKELLKKMSEKDLSNEVKETLNHLRARGLLLAIGSSSKNTRFILGQIGLGDFFDAISDGNNITRSKPDPEVFLLGAKELSLHAKECIVFEDAVAGVEAAHNGGMKAVGIGTRENLPNAELCIPGLKDIHMEDLISQLSS